MEQIPPGGEGKLTVTLKTQNFGGKPLAKNVKIFTNDPKTPVVQVYLTGRVERVIEIEPKRLVLMGYVDEELEQTATILAEEKYRFKITEAKARSGKNIAFTLEELRKDGRSGYLLTVTNLKEAPGQFYDTLLFTTDSKLTPRFFLRVVVKLYKRKTAAQGEGALPNPTS